MGIIILIIVIFIVITYLCAEGAKEDAARTLSNNIRKEEEERDKEYAEWLEKMGSRFANINRHLGCGVNYFPKDAYDSVWKWLENIPEGKGTYDFEQMMRSHQSSLRYGINEILKSMPGYYSMFQCVSAMRCLQASCQEDPQFDAAIDALEQIINYAEKDIYHIRFRDYGDCYLPAEKVKDISSLEAKIEKLTDKIGQATLNIRDVQKEYYENLTYCLTPDYIDTACELMWCNAIRKPFDQEAFKSARAFFGAYTIRCLVDNYYVEHKYAVECRKNKTSENIIIAEKVEAILALIYAKNQMGGDSIVQQDKEYVDRWLHEMVYLGRIDECYLLASGLSWMGLYDLERDVLRQLVSMKVSLDADIQDRLSFLESGGKSNIRIYRLEDFSDKEQNMFYYDSSPIDWREDAFDMFFRKLDMTHSKLNYSLAISNWMKTLPLASGQEISEKQLKGAFDALVRDFDGEVIMEKRDAKALNLENIEYIDSYIFSFVGDRNKCVSVLFWSEKYGRNLNLTIITMFTPVEDVKNEVLKRYALAIKENIYVESFRDSLIQTVDEVITGKRTIYGERSSEAKVFS